MDYTAKNSTFLSDIEDALVPGSPFSAFLLADEICLCLILIFSIPITKNDSIFWFLAIVTPAFLTQTCVEVAYFVSIYFYTSSYTFWSWVHDSVVSFCYSSFLFNFQYGIVLYSWQTIYTAIKKKPVSKSASRVPYIVIFVITLIQSAIYWQIMIVGMVSALLILVLAPVCILVSIICVICCKTDKSSTIEIVRRVKSRLLWNIPCLILSMADVVVDLYLNFRGNAYKTTAVHNKEYIFPILFPPIAMVTMFFTLPALRRAMFPCCYPLHPSPSNDRMFLLTRNTSASGSSAPSERSSISTIANQPIVTYPSNAVVPYVEGAAPYYPHYGMPNMYPMLYGAQGYPQEYQQGQPIYVPIPIPYYNPTPMPTRPNEMSVVQ